MSSLWRRSLSPAPRRGFFMWRGYASGRRANGVPEAGLIGFYSPLHRIMTSCPGATARRLITWSDNPVCSRPQQAGFSRSDLAMRSAVQLRLLSYSDCVSRCCRAQYR